MGDGYQQARELGSVDRGVPRACHPVSNDARTDGSGFSDDVLAGGAGTGWSSSFVGGILAWVRAASQAEGVDNAVAVHSGRHVRWLLLRRCSRGACLPGRVEWEP